MKLNPLYLDGQFVTTDTSIHVRNPASGETIAQMSTCEIGRAHV